VWLLPSVIYKCMNIDFFWDVKTCSLVNDCRRLEENLFNPDVWGSRFLKNSVANCTSEMQHFPEDSDFSMQTARLAAPNGLSSKSVTSINWMSLSLNLTFGCAHPGIFMWLELQMQFRVT